MVDTGIYLRGLFISSADKYDKDGRRVGDTVLVAAGVNSYKVTVKSGLPASLEFGGPITLRVRPFVYNGGVYYSGDVVNDEVF